jgi:hypothetical protein
MIHMTTKAWQRCMLRTLATVLLTVGAAGTYGDALAQKAERIPCRPVSERTGEMGCWIISADPIGQLPQGPLFWHLDTYAMRAAAEAAKGPHGTVVEALGKIWLFTIAEGGWRPAGGVRIAEIGPLEVRSDTKYTARYVESISLAGTDMGPAHRHPGPEAAYTQSGESCFETPEGRMVGRAGGEHVIVPGGRPMQFATTGSEKRHALALVLHDSTQPSSTRVLDWTPKGLCKS